MIRRILNYSTSKEKMTSIVRQVHKIREGSDIINIVPGNTGNSWLGVKNAGMGLFPRCTIELPQVYSQSILNSRQLSKLVSELANANFSKIIFNGMPDYFVNLIKSIKKINSNCSINVIYHGFYSELGVDNEVSTSLFKLTQLSRSAIVSRVGFVKRGFEEVYHKMTESEASYLVLKIPVSYDTSHSEKDQKIGLLAGTSERKNFGSQFFAAIGIPGVHLVVPRLGQLSAFATHCRVSELGFLHHADFLSELGRNRINSHVTFSESACGQVFAESLGMGVPCLTGPTHGYLEGNQTLQELLIVERSDDALCIRKKMLQLLEERDEIGVLCRQHVEHMNHVSDCFLSAFLGDT